LKRASIDGLFNGWDTLVILLDQVGGLELTIMLSMDCIDHPY
jgi:hypothetical protein